MFLIFYVPERTFMYPYSLLLTFNKFCEWGEQCDKETLPHWWGEGGAPLPPNG
jgi:hypothetical protein